MLGDYADTATVCGCRGVPVAISPHRLVWKNKNGVATRRIHERDRRTDRQTPHDDIGRAYASHRAAKILSNCCLVFCAVNRVCFVMRQERSEATNRRPLTTHAYYNNTRRSLDCNNSLATDADASVTSSNFTKTLEDPSASAKHSPTLWKSTVDEHYRAC